MDNPWATSWAEPDSAAQQPWKPNITTLNDDETDITVPTWSAPTQESLWPADDHDDGPVHLWSQASHADDPADSWGTSSRFTNIFGASKSSLPAVETTELEPAVTVPDDDGDTSPPASDDDNDTVSQHSLPKSPEPEPSPPASPDGFGGFATAMDEPPSSTSPAFAMFPDDMSTSLDPVWGPSALERESSEDNTADQEQHDEWEEARRRKERQDRQVPPEFLRSILSQCEELLVKVSPQVSEDQQDEEPAALHRDLEVSGLSTVVEKLASDNISLSPPVAFSTTFTAKHMTEAVKMTRHCAFTRLSPMSQYLSTKGSTSWEASVKSRQEIVLDDALLPKGWKIIEKDEPKEAPAAEAKPSSGGLLSFFGRRSTAPAGNNQRQRPSSPVVSTPPSAARSSTSTATMSPRSSMDVMKSPASIAPPAASPVTVTTTTTATSHSASPSASTTTFSSVASPTTTPQPPEIFPEVAPPSAVSRFLGRFSRNKSGSLSPRGSMALSSDDLEFLSDIVPSAGDDDADDTSHQLDALEKVIQSSPLPTKLPPPLPPPPKTPVIKPPPKPPVMQPPAQPTVLIPSSRGEMQSPQHRKSSSVDDWSLAFADPVDSPRSISSQPIPPTAMSPSTFSPLQPTISPTAISPSVAPPTHPAFAISSQPEQSGSSLMDDVFGTSSTPPPPPSLQSYSRSRPSSRVSSTIGMQQAPPKRPTVTAIMSSGRPSSSSSSSTSPALFSLPPPPSSGRQTPTLSPPPKDVPSIAISPTSFGLPPPPSSGRQTPAVPAKQVPAALLMDDDDFSDFHSGSVSAPTTNVQGFGNEISHGLSMPSGFGGFAAAAGTTSSATAFDDFDDFVSAKDPSFDSPVPPGVPAKQSVSEPMPLTTPKKTVTPPANIILPESERRAPQRTTPGHRRAGSRVDESQHQRTQSLLDVAASRKGIRWPAPASPLPEAIPPPQASGSSSGAFDGFGDEEAGAGAGGGDGSMDMDFFSSGAGRGSQTSMQSQQAQAIASMVDARSSPPTIQLPRFSPPPPPQQHRLQSSLSPPPLGLGFMQQTNGAAKQGLFVAQQPVAGKKSDGGLSAQDLSFFEGL